MLKLKLTTLFLSVFLLSHAQIDNQVYKGLKGDYTFSDFKLWSDSIDCKEKSFVLEVGNQKNYRKISDAEIPVRKSLRSIPLLIHVGSPGKGLQYNGYIKIHEGGARIYMLISKAEKKALMKLSPETEVYCSTPKQRLKGNMSELRFLVERNPEEFDAPVSEYLKANSLIVLTALCKDVEDCENPATVTIRRRVNN